MCEKSKILEGIIDKTNSGSGYIVREKIDKDVFVSERNILNSFDGDLVEFVMISKKEARITKIKERKKTRFVGVTKTVNQELFVNTTGKKDKIEFFINTSKKEKTKDNQLAVVKFTSWTKEFPEAQIVKVIGDQGVVENEIHAILQEYNLPYDFNKELENQAKNLENLQTKEETATDADIKSNSSNYTTSAYIFDANNNAVYY